MTEGWAGWVEAHELPASEHLRTVAEILSAPPSPEERRALRREQAEAEAKRASAADTADNAAAAAFMAKINGTPPRNVLAEAAAEVPFRDHEAAARRRAAVDALKPLGLADVITGGTSGCVIDPHLGILEPEPDLAQRAAMDRRYEFERSQREADERNRYVRAAAAQLEERRRARGLDRREAHRTAGPDDAARRQYERACAEIDVRPVSYR